MRVLGYIRCSTDEQTLDAQRQQLLEECDRRRWELVEIIEDQGFSARDLVRPGIERALGELKDGLYDALMVTKLDRLSRSLLDFTTIMQRAQAESWALVALDLNVDTTTPAGEAMANVLATFAQFERKLIGQRTKDALQEKKRQGVKLGRPFVIPDNVVEEIQECHAHGMSYNAIARQLNEARVPPATGRKWWPTTVRKVVLRDSGSQVEAPAA